MWTTIDSNPLEVGTINDCISISKRQKINLETIDENYVTIRKPRKNPSKIQNYRIRRKYRSNRKELEPGFTPIDLGEDGAVPLSSDENYRKRIMKTKMKKLNACRKRRRKRNVERKKKMNV